MVKKLTKDEYQTKLNNSAPLNYTIVGQYNGGKKPITVIHDVCGKKIHQKCADNLLRIKSCIHCDPT